MQSLTAASPPEDISELERYKRRLQSLEGASDPARVLQLRQMQQLLSLMQRSLAKEGAKKAPTPVAAPTLPPPPALPVVAPEPEPEPVPLVKEVVSEEPPPVAKELPLPKESPPEVPLVSTPPGKQAPALPIPAPSRPPKPEIPAWFFQVQLSTSIGYQENLLRSAFSKLDSAFLRGEAEVQLLNTKRTTHRVMALGRYERTHFLDASSVRDEDLLFLLGQVDQRVPGNLWLGLLASFFSAHQPLDDPDLVDLDSGSIPLKFTQLSISPQVTWEPSKAHAWVASLDYRRETTEGLEIEEQNNDQWGMSLRYTFEPSRKHRLQLNYQFAEVNYEERRARLPSGVFLDDTLETTRQEWSASYRRTWQKQETRWRAEARLRWVIEDDEVGGYDDLSRVEVRGRLGWRHAKRTELRVELRYGQYFYDSRQRSQEDPHRRERGYWAGGLAFEHAFNDRLAYLLKADFRENTGNRRVDRYGTQTLSTGIRLTF